MISIFRDSEVLFDTLLISDLISICSECLCSSISGLFFIIVFYLICGDLFYDPCMCSLLVNHGMCVGKEVNSAMSGVCTS